MKADEIMHVLRLTAMGRINHPDQQRLCEELERLLSARVEALASELLAIEADPGPANGLEVFLAKPDAPKAKRAKKAE